MRFRFWTRGNYAGAKEFRSDRLTNSLYRFAKNHVSPVYVSKLLFRKENPSQLLDIDDPRPLSELFQGHRFYNIEVKIRDIRKYKEYFPEDFDDESQENKSPRRVLMRPHAQPTHYDEINVYRIYSPIGEKIFEYAMYSRSISACTNTDEFVEAMFRFTDLANERKVKVLEHVDAEELIKMLQLNRLLRHYVLNNEPFSKTLRQIDVKSPFCCSCIVKLGTWKRSYNSCTQFGCLREDDQPKRLALASLLSRIRFCPDFALYDYRLWHGAMACHMIVSFLPKGRIFRRLRLSLMDWGSFDSAFLVQGLDVQVVNLFEFNFKYDSNGMDAALFEKPFLMDMIARNANDCEELIVGDVFSLKNMLEINETTGSRRVFWVVSKYYHPNEWFADLYTIWRPKNNEKLRMIGFTWDSECKLERSLWTLGNQSTISQFTGKDGPLFKFFSQDWPLLEIVGVEKGRYRIVVNQNSYGAYLHFMFYCSFWPWHFRDGTCGNWNGSYTILTKFIANPMDVPGIGDYYEFFTLYE